MRKFPVIVALVLIAVGGAYALVANLLPNNSQFPRIPTGNGTVGGAITKILGITDLATYNGTGIVANTNMLSGITADKLLKRNNCGAGNVWLKTDATGKPVCGANGGMLATSIGTINTIVGTVTAYRADGTTKILTGSDPILEGDIIQTNPGAAITIAFSDLSIIRLDGGSTVSLDTGVTTSGQNIAYAILNNGGLWGRVLTETGGYYIGSSDIVAGVRGTSVSYTQNGANPLIKPDGVEGKWKMINQGTSSSMGGEMRIVHSTLPGTVIDCISGSGILSFTGINRYSMNIYSYPGMCESLKMGINYTLQSPSYIQSLPEIYNTNSRIANNTVADLEYMVQLLKNGTISTPKKIRIQNEINVTKPGPAEYNAICPDDGATKIVYWNSLSGSNIGPCQPDVLAFADYTKSDEKMYINGNSFPLSPIRTGATVLNQSYIDDEYIWRAGAKNNYIYKLSLTTDSTDQYWISKTTSPKFDFYDTVYVRSAPKDQQKDEGGRGGNWDAWTYPYLYWMQSGYSGSLNSNGLGITLSGQYISYPVPILTDRIGSLAGKKVTIELGSPVGSTMNCVSNKCYVANFGNEMYYIQKDSTDCVSSTVPGKYAFCKKLGISSATPYPSTGNNNVTGKTQIVFTLSATIPSQFLLGNNTIPGTLPLMNTIKKVSIQ